MISCVDDKKSFGVKPQATGFRLGGETTQLAACSLKLVALQKRNINEPRTK